MNLEYLNFELDHDSKIITENGFRQKCYLKKNYAHELHGKEQQLNSIVDMIISIGEKMEKDHKTHQRNMNQLIEEIKNNTKISQEIRENQQYIKNQAGMLDIRIRELEEIKPDNIGKNFNIITEKLKELNK